DALDDRAVEGRVARSRPGLRIADVEVDDRRARGGGLERRRRDLVGGDRDELAAARRVAHAGDGAGDEDLPVHRADDTGAGGRDPAWCSAARRRGAGAPRAWSRSCFIAYENEPRSAGQTRCAEPPEPVGPNAPAGGPKRPSRVCSSKPTPNAYGRPVTA